MNRRRFGTTILMGGVAFLVPTARSGASDHVEIGPEHLARRYGRFLGAEHGWYFGTAEDGRPYRLPRLIVNVNNALANVARGRPSYDVRDVAPGSLNWLSFEAMVRSAVPPTIHAWIEGVVHAALDLGSSDVRLAADLSADQAEALRTFLMFSWIHSRDVTISMSAMGYPIAATGVHDVYEPVAAGELKRALHDSKDPHSEWFARYVSGLDDGGEVNIGFFNPHLAADMLSWRPGAREENAAFAHRLSPHHQGTSDNRLDPMESVVNVLLHSREHLHGVRRTGCGTFEELKRQLAEKATGLAMARSEFGVSVAQDAILVLEHLEREGRITPWNRLQGC